MSVVCAQQYQREGTDPACFRLRFTISAIAVQNGVKSCTSMGTRRLRGQTTRVGKSLIPTRKERLATTTQALTNYLALGTWAVK